MRTVRVLLSAASLAVIVSIVSACGESPTAPERSAVPAARASLLAVPGDTSGVTIYNTSVDMDHGEQPMDTSGYRRGGGYIGGQN